MGKQNQSKLEPLGIALRLTQAFYSLVLVFGLLYALFTNGNDFNYDLGMIYALVQMAVAPRCIYLIQRRSRSTRAYCIGSAILCLVLSLCNMLFSNAYDSVSALVGPALTNAFVASQLAGSAAIALYFALSKHVRRIMVVDTEERSRQQEREALCPRGVGMEQLAMDPQLDEWRDGAHGVLDIKPYRVLSWPWLRNIVIDYCTFSMLGHWAEIGFCLLILAGVFMGGYDPTNVMLWEQWLYPFPAEGFAAIAVAVFLYPLKRWLLRKLGGRVLITLLITFVACGLLCTSIDFLTGITCNADYQLWDYRDLPFNFMGQIVLQNSLTYTIICTLAVWVVYPAYERLLRIIPQGAYNAVFAGIVGAYLFLEILYFVNVGPNGLIFG